MLLDVKEAEIAVSLLCPLSELAGKLDKKEKMINKKPDGTFKKVSCS
jgi:hypothetical protein